MVKQYFVFAFINLPFRFSMPILSLLGSAYFAKNSTIEVLASFLVALNFFAFFSILDFGYSSKQLNDASETIRSEFKNRFFNFSLICLIEIMVVYIFSMTVIFIFDFNHLATSTYIFASLLGISLSFSNFLVNSSLSFGLEKTAYAIFSIVYFSLFLILYIHVEQMNLTPLNFFKSSLLAVFIGILITSSVLLSNSKHVIMKSAEKNYEGLKLFCLGTISFFTFNVDIQILHIFVSADEIANYGLISKYVSFITILFSLLMPLYWKNEANILKTQLLITERQDRVLVFGTVVLALSSVLVTALLYLTWDYLEVGHFNSHLLFSLMLFSVVLQIVNGRYAIALSVRKFF